MRTRLAVASLLALLAACGDDAGDGTTTGVTTAPGSTSGAGGSTGAETPTTAQGEDGGGAQGDSSGSVAPKLDVPSGETTGGASAAGCSKVDFLFVIDNSGSMADEQQNLIDSFPGFIATITRTLAATDFHIMAVSTDGGDGMGGSSVVCMNGVCSCTPAPACCETACTISDNCNGFACDALPDLGPCHAKYGTGKQYSAEGQFCEIADGRLYMLDSQPALAQTFQCSAYVGAYGSGDEKPMLAASEACSPALNGPGGCNAGFLRDDAVLVLTFITDEEDDDVDAMGSPGGPSEWFEAIVAAKNGDPDAVVVLGLLGDSNLPNGLCAPDVDPNMNGTGAEPAPRLQAFVDMFDDNGVVGSVCAPDYTPFFAEAVAVIDTACDMFEPPN